MTIAKAKKPTITFEVVVVSYNGIRLAIPSQGVLGGTVFDYVRETLKREPKVQAILWNDIVRPIESDGKGGFTVDLSKHTNI